MRIVKSFFLALSIVSLGVLNAHDAAACGGCAVTQTESTQVTGHRMILSVAKDRTTLWDQIQYSGNPKEFGWILPIKGNAGFNLDTDFEVSSDALFATMEQLTQVSISSPFISCGSPCGPTGAPGAGEGDGAGTGTGGGGGVTVVAEKVAGPFAIVHLQATQPNALKEWLATNQYVVPPEASAIIDAYVAEQFDFVAMKLDKTDTVSAMRPVRIKLPGAAPTLPLRMVGVGTGNVTSMTLWVVGEGRYETSNFPVFEINESELVWNWDTSSSNYKDLRQKGYDAANGKAWLVEAAEPSSPFNFQFPLEDLVTYDVANSGYGDANGVGAKEELYADLDALYGAIPESSMWLMRLHAELPRSALATDLSLGASASQKPATRFFQTVNSIGTPPPCPPTPQCPEPPDTGDDDQWGGYFGATSATSGGGCAMGGDAASSAALGALALSAALAFARRRRNK
jgi:hypothetical protein